MVAPLHLSGDARAVKEAAGQLEQADLFGLAQPASMPAAVAAASPDASTLRAAAALPPAIRIGTSSWSFGGWADLVYRDFHNEAELARHGLSAYARSPLLRTVCIDRSFYAPLESGEYAAYAAQVPEDFKFMVKAPAAVCDATRRDAKGVPGMPNPDFLDASLAADTFIGPALEGLGSKAGALVFQLSPLPPAWLSEPAALVDRLAEFFGRLPAIAPACPRALELRDAKLLTPRLIRMLREFNIRYCIGVHPRLPDVSRQAAALAQLDHASMGTLIVRWNLRAGLNYTSAKARYAPFRRLVDEDLATRDWLANLAARYARAGQASLIAVSNHAEGSAPLSCLRLAETIIGRLAAAPESTEADPQDRPAPMPGPQGLSDGT